MVDMFRTAIKWLMLVVLHL